MMGAQYNARPASQGQQQVRILHISALHFTSRQHATNERDALLDDLRSANGKRLLPVDLMVVAGDITSRGKEHEFAAAREFLVEVMADLALPSERLCMVPGNHDVNREAGEFAVFRSRAARLMNFSSGLYEPLRGQPYPSDPRDQYITRLFAGPGVQTIELNSVLSSHTAPREVPGINPDAFVAGLEHSVQEAKAARVSPFAPNGQLTRIVVWHHAPRTFERLLDTRLFLALRLGGVQLALHGGLHQAWPEVVASVSSTGPVVVGSGTLRIPDRQDRGLQLYNIVEISRNTGRVRVHSRQRRGDERWRAWDGWANGYIDLPLPSYSVEQIDASSIRSLLAEEPSLEEKVARGKFDVFVSSSGTDKAIVQTLADELRDRGLNPWVDAANILPGQVWQEEIERTLPQVRAVVLLLAHSKARPWQNVEVAAALDQAARQGTAIIPVLMPGADVSDLPPFLRGHSYIRTQTSVAPAVADAVEETLRI